MEVPIYKHKYAIDNSSMQIIGIPSTTLNDEFIRSNIPKEKN